MQSDIITPKTSDEAAERVAENAVYYRDNYRCVIGLMTGMCVDVYWCVLYVY